MLLRIFLVLVVTLGSILASSSLNGAQGQEKSESVRLSWIGRYSSGLYKQSAAEIVGFDAVTSRVYVVNSARGVVDILDLRQPTAPKYLGSLDASDIGSNANSVAVKNGVIAVAIAAPVKTDPGSVVFFDANGQRQAVVQVGALPDAVTFSPDGKFLLVANEGEPSDDYSVDPEGTVSLIDLAKGIKNLDQSNVKEIHFQAFNGQEENLRSRGVRIYGPRASAAQDFEPEWCEFSANSRTAYVCLQENNALAVIDVTSATVQSVLPFGYKDWSANGQWAGRGLDASDQDGKISLSHWPVFGMFQPDTIRVREINGDVYILGANEGDGRSWGWSEEARVSELKLDPQAFPNAALLQAPENLGRLIVTTTLGIANQVDPSALAPETKSHAIFNQLYTYGGRSMAIWRVRDDALELVFDTGSQMEETIAELTPHFFNNDGASSGNLDGRSAAKGPEPEGLVLGEVGGRTYAFVGLERVSGIMVYDVTTPNETKFVQYLNTRTHFVEEPAESELVKSDISPEGLCFVPAAESPDPEGRPLLLVGNEVSGTVSVFAIDFSSRVSER
ncbi:MAG: choice-of-anchor I family protein [Planctomycetaceae bacterium]|nr:choice-of-anchor I family protein [Planctomycetaceae bacterium]